MAYKGVLEDIRKCVNLQKPDRVPVFALSEEFDVAESGLIYNDYNRDAKLMADCQISAIKRMDYDWAWLQVDDCIEFEVLGVGTKGEGNILPATCDYLPATRNTLENLKMPNPKKKGRMPVLLEAIERIKDEFGDTVCVTGRTAAPFSSVTLLYGITETLMLMFDDPKLVADTIKFCTELQVMWGTAQIEAGADALWFGDCNASGHLISAEHYEEFVFDSVKECAKVYQDAGAFTMYHASEHSIEHLKLQAKTGVSAVSIGPGRDIGEAKEAIGSDVCIIGNVDPIVILLEGSPEQVYNESKRVMNIGKENGGYLFNSGEMIPRDTSDENMRAMISAARECGS